MHFVNIFMSVAGWFLCDMWGMLLKWFYGKRFVAGACLRVESRKELSLVDSSLRVFPSLNSFASPKNYKNY